MDIKLKDLIIDPEFEQQIPGLASDEFNQLKRNVLADKRILTPLIVWGRTVIDGHNRYRILKQYPDIPFTVTQMDFPDRYAAMAWICRNQLGRRNLTSEQKRYLIGRQYEAERASHGGRREMERNKASGRFTASVQNDPLRSGHATRDRIAKENGVTESFVMRAQGYANGVDAAEEALPGIKKELLDGKIRPTNKKVAAVAKAPPEEREELARKLREPQKRAGKKKEKKTGQKQDPIPDGGPGLKKTKAEVLREIEKISEDMLHADGVAAATEDDMMSELKDAYESMKWRWDTCAEFYPTPVRTESGRKRIIDLAGEAIAYFEAVKEGVLWDDSRRMRL